MHGVPPPPAVAAAGDSQEFPGQQLGSAPVQPFPLRSNPLRSTLTSRGWPTPFLFFFVFCFLFFVFLGGGGGCSLQVPGFVFQTNAAALPGRLRNADRSFLASPCTTCADGGSCRCACLRGQGMVCAWIQTGTRAARPGVWHLPRPAHAGGSAGARAAGVPIRAHCRARLGNVWGPGQPWSSGDFVGHRPEGTGPVFLVRA